MPLVPGTADVLSTPAAPTIQQNATGASAAITYAIVAVNEAGQDSIPSAGVATPANNASTANNTISWVAVPGAAQYRVIKNGALLANVGSSITTYTDSAGSAGATYVATTSTIGNPIAFVPSASSPVDGQKWTYSAAKVGLVPAASATDIFTITGSASKTVRVTHIEIWATTTAATAAALDVLLLKRSTADTAGTSTGSPTPVPHDINAPAVSATVLSYTVNPTTGTLVGTAIRNSKLFQTLATYTATDFPAPVGLIWDFGNRPGSAIVLRGITDVLAINLNGVSASAGALFDISAEWTEE
jgi:hypothetical protein